MEGLPDIVSEQPISVKRLRIGVFMLLVWWIPIWALSPLLKGVLDIFGVSINVSTLTIIIAAIQTVIGLLGAVIAGKQITTIVKSESYKKAPKTMWRILISGKTGS